MRFLSNEATFGVVNKRNELITAVVVGDAYLHDRLHFMLLELTVGRPLSYESDLIPSEWYVRPLTVMHNSMTEMEIYRVGGFLQLVFTGDVTGEIRLSMKLTNNSDSRQAFKVKCTRNDLFRIRPATGILEYGKSTYITVTYR